MATATCSTAGKRSDVWKFYTQEATNSVVCKLCERKFAYHGGTSNLRDHLERLHSQVYKSSSKQTDSKQTTIIGLQRCTERRAKAVSDMILNMIIKDIRPIAIVEGEGFQEMMRLVESGYKVPSRKYFTKLLHLKYSKVVAVVHNQGSNIRLCGGILENDVGWDSISCAAHKLQLCVNGALNSQQSIARAVGARKLVGHFRHSALATGALKKRQVQMNLPEKKLKQEISTRWNSTFYMIQRLLESRWPVVAFLSDESVTKRSDRFLDLRSEQWDLLQELANVLEPIEIATVFLSYESNVSISCIYPIGFGLLDNLQVSEDVSPSCSLFKNEVASSIRSRWCLDSIDPLAISTLATCLDPRFRNLKFLSDTLKTSVKEELKERVQQIQHDPEIDQDSQALQDQPPPSKKTALDKLLGVEEEELESCMEVDTYLSGKPISRSTNPLEWWKENKARFPCLAQLARTVLCIPATSTPSEDFFQGRTNDKKTKK